MAAPRACTSDIVLLPEMRQPNLPLRLAQHRHHTVGIGRRGILRSRRLRRARGVIMAMRECAVGGDPKLKRREARVCELCVKMGGDNDFNIGVVEIL